MAVEQKSFREMLVPIIVLLISGTYSSISTKILYNWSTKSYDGSSNKFEKPYFFTLMMFVGEAMCLFYRLIEQWGKERRKAMNADVEKNLLEKKSESMGKKPHILVFCALSAFDLSATALNGVGLLWVSASANQMLRGSMIVFTGIFSVLIFRKQLGWRKWAGIGVVVVGLVLVGAAGMARGGGGSSNADASSGKVLAGILLIVGGSGLNSLQNVFEEFLLKGTEVDPLEVVGWEGIFGSLLCVILLLPITQAIPGSQFGSSENTTDTLYQLTTNPGMTFTILGYSLALALMNYYSQLVAKYMSAVIRMLLSTCRVVLVWVINLLIYYAIPGGDGYGENWDQYSWLQLVGFFYLIVGTGVYMRQPPVAEDQVKENDGEKTIND